MLLAELIERPPKDTILRYQRFNHLNNWALIRYNFIKKTEKVLKKKQGLELLFYQITTDVNDYIIQIISMAKESFGFSHSAESIFIIATELIQNAVKANFKRIYFKQTGINPDNDEEYTRGLKNFKKILCKNSAHLAHLAWLLSFDVVFRVQIKDKNLLCFDIINNVPLYDVERERIRLKRAIAAKYQTIGEFYEVAGDETEGAGLGMMVIRMVMKGISLNPEHFYIFEDNEKNTIARLTIPLF
ncbi:MAG: hypothetical protein KAR07_08360 [Spirochaetes bacterium]|nr:hypothetical protein [Spirochaetota bacterium]